MFAMTRTRSNESHNTRWAVIRLWKFKHKYNKLPQKRNIGNERYALKLVTFENVRSHIMGIFLGEECIEAELKMYQAKVRYIYGKESKTYTKMQ